MSREKLKALEELQRIDLQIRELSMQAESHPARLKQIVRTYSDHIALPVILDPPKNAPKASA